jgi:zinc protease
MMQRGSKTLTYQEVEDKLTQLRADLSFNSTPGLLQIRVKTKAENVSDVVALIGDLVRNPRFEASELEVVRRQILTGIEGALKDPQALAPQAVRRALAPFERDDVRYVPTMEEEIEMYKSVTIEQIREFYADFISGQAGELAVVGDFDDQMIKKQVLEIVGDWKAKMPYVRFDRRAVTHVAGGVERINTPDKSNAMLYGSMQFNLDDDAPAFAAIEIGNYILGGGSLSSRLADRVRQQEGLSYGIASGVTGRHRDQRTDFTLYAITNPQNVDRLLEVINEEIKRLREKGVTEEELARAKDSYLQGEKVRRAEDGSLASQLLGSMFNGRTLEFNAEHEQRIAKLTVEEVNQAIVDLINPSNIVIGVAGDFK